MLIEYRKKNPFTLTSADEVQLQKLAPLFGIDFRRVDEQTYSLHINDGEGGRAAPTMLPAAVAHRRLLTEICGKASKWIYFYLGESCRDTLMGQSDARLKRVAELYSLDRSEARSPPV
jgi:hypothetical protein